MNFKGKLMECLGGLTRVELVRQKALTEINEFFILRADAEKLYQKAMERLASYEAPRLEEGSSLEKAFVFIKLDCENKAKSSKQFYERLHKEVIEPLQIFDQSQTSKLKCANKSWTHNSQKYLEIREQILENQDTYSKALNLLNESLKNYETLKAGINIKKEQKTKIENLIRKLAGESLESLKNYRNAQTLGKGVRTDLINFISEHLEIYQEEEEKRIFRIKNCFKRYSELNKELIQQKSQIEAEIDNISVEEEIARIIQQVETQKINLSELPFYRTDSKAESLLLELERKRTENHIFSGPEILLTFDKVTEKAVETRTNLAKIINLCWNSKPLPTSSKEKFREYICDRKAREVFLECINEYRKKGLFSITPKAFNYFAELFYYLLLDIIIIIFL